MTVRKEVANLILLLLVFLMVSAPDSNAEQLVRIHGQLTTTLRPEQTDSILLNRNNRSDTAFDVLDLDLFLESTPSDELQIHSWLSFNDAYRNSFVLASAYFLYEVVPSGRLFFEAGKIPAPFGTYLERFRASRGPIIGIPFAYHYGGGIAQDRIPADADDLLSARGTGQFGAPAYASYESAGGWRGMTMLYAACYDFGAVALGAAGPVEYKLGFINGAPGAPAPGQDSNDSKTVVGRLGWSPSPAVRLGVSGARGAYLRSDSATSPNYVGSDPNSDPGSRRGDGTSQTSTDWDKSNQTLVGIDLEWSEGYWTVWSEAVFDRTESPFVEQDLDRLSYFIEAHRKLRPGLVAGFRWDDMLFGKIEASDGRDVRWDLSRRRLELGVAYDVSRSFTVRGAFQMNHTGFGGFDPSDNLAALQLQARF